MATLELEEEISALKEEIAEYNVLLKAASAGDKVAYVNLITERGKTLNLLLLQQQQLQGK
jgi:hypothetical protein